MDQSDKWISQTNAVSFDSFTINSRPTAIGSIATDGHRSGSRAESSEDFSPTTQPNWPTPTITAVVAIDYVGATFRFTMALVNDPEDGWLWNTGLCGSPGWVTWRSNGQYIGWMPMPPTTPFSRVEATSDLACRSGSVRAISEASTLFGWYGPEYDESALPEIGSSLASGTWRTATIDA